MRYQQAPRSESSRHRPLQLPTVINEALHRIKPINAELQRSPPQDSVYNEHRALPGSLAPHHLQQALELLLDNRDTPMAIIEIALACNLTRSHFSRAFKLSTGLSPLAWRLKARLEKAKKLLATSLSLTEVGLEAGFCDQSHFTKTFTRLAGMTPKAWRAEQVNGSSQSPY
ncbi:helix-turn-helix domain-containing protein [Pseudomonas endophytica]|uniref:helix-turn-helix domain-containing protein n=1 Tax=Pseudomonas endophytica TaxID=1563157 RepID=UPI0009EA0AAD|nr:AraC family transcriptional regulator [Pseudomonas endophytica]